MTTFDATGNPVQINQYYGYTQSQNGITKIIIGRCKDIKPGKIQLNNIKETTRYFVSDVNSVHPGYVDHPERARTVSSAICFPVDINTVKTP